MMWRVSRHQAELYKSKFGNNSHFGKISFSSVSSVDHANPILPVNLSRIMLAVRGIKKLTQIVGTLGDNFDHSTRHSISSECQFMQILAFRARSYVLFSQLLLRNSQLLFLMHRYDV